jgi:uncharacterized alkaline shock family protein YloU
MSDAHVLHEAAGTISITPSALEHVVLRAAETVDGAQLRRRRHALEIRIADGAAIVDLALTAPYGAVLPELARTVQHRIADALATTCGLRVEAVDVTVEELVGA